HFVIVHQKNAFRSGHGEFSWMLNFTVMRQTLSRFVGPVYVGTMKAGKLGEIVPESEIDGMVPSGHRVERAAGDFRRGVPVIVHPRANESALAVAAETVTNATLARLAAYGGAPALILTHARAGTLKIRLYTDEVVSVPLARKTTAAEIRAIADPATDLDH